MLSCIDGGDDIYRGSTSLPLGRRFSNHKQNAGNPSRLKWFGGSKLYKKMREVGVHNWKTAPLITYACDRGTIVAFEQVWVETTGANLNTFSPVNEDVAEREYDIKRRRRNKETMRFYCEICDIKCKDKYDLRRHFDTLKHSYAWLNSLD